MKHFIAAALAAAIMSGSAAQACTPDELQAKAEAVAAKIQALAQQDPQKAADWSQKFAAQQGSAEPQNLDDVCKLYDAMLASLPG
jgi:hypothetical protein